METRFSTNVPSADCSTWFACVRRNRIYRKSPLALSRIRTAMRRAKRRGGCKAALYFKHSRWIKPHTANSANKSGHGSVSISRVATISVASRNLTRGSFSYKLKLAVAVCSRNISNLRSSNFSYLNVGEGGTGMMTETADHVTGVTIIVRVTTERRVQTQFTTFIGCADVLVNGVDGFQYAAGQLLKFAKFHWLLHAVVFQIIYSLRCLEGARASNRQPIHIREFTLFGSVDIISGSEIETKIFMKNLSLIID